MIDENKWEIVSETADEIVLRKKRDDWDECKWGVTAYGTVLRLINPYPEHKTFFNLWPSKELAEKAAAMMRVTNALIFAKLRVEPEFDPHWGSAYQYKYAPSSTSSRVFLTGDLGNPVYSTQDKALEARQLLIDAGVWVEEDGK